MGVVGFNVLSKTIPAPKETFHSPIAIDDQFLIANAPSNSLKGTIESFSGDVQWESRTATQPAKLSNPIIIQQGEKVITGKNGKIALIFPEIENINLHPDSDLSIVQTLPSHFVFEQTGGVVDYSNTQNTSLSIRTLHMLITATQATITIAIDKDTHDIVLSLNKGSAILAFNNKENISTVIHLSTGDQYLYNDDDREGVQKKM